MNQVAMKILDWNVLKFTLNKSLIITCIIYCQLCPCPLAKHYALYVMLSSISTFEIFNTIVNHMTQARVVSANRQGNMGASVTIDEPCQTCVQSVKITLQKV